MPDNKSNDTLDLVKDIMSKRASEEGKKDELSKPKNFIRIFEIDEQGKTTFKDSEIAHFFQQEFEGYYNAKGPLSDADLKDITSRFEEKVQDKKNEVDVAYDREKEAMFEKFDKAIKGAKSGKELSAVRKKIISEMDDKKNGLSKEEKAELTKKADKAQKKSENRGLATKIVETFKGAFGLDKEEQQKAADVTKKLEESAKKVKAAQAKKVEFEESPTVQKLAQIAKAKGPTQTKQTSGKKDFGAIMKQATGAAKAFAEGASGGERVGGSQASSQSAGKGQAKSGGRGK